MENLAKEINENCQSIPRNSLTVELDGKRRVSTCSGYSTTTGIFFSFLFLFFFFENGKF